MLITVQTLVGDLIRDESDQVTTDQRDSAIALALVKYSADRPREDVAAVVSLGGQRLALPPGWADGMAVSWVEWPLNQVPPARMSHELYRGLNGLEILLESSVGAGDTPVVHYTRPHILSGSEDTTPAAHNEAIAAYASALLFEQMAANAAGNGAPTIAADSADHKSQAMEYASRARTARKRYADVLGITDAVTLRPAGTAVAWPSRSRFPGAGARFAGSGLQ